MADRGRAVFLGAVLALLSTAPAARAQSGPSTPADRAGAGERAFAGRTDEIVELRDAFSRHFRNPDGTITAVLYSAPIHYRAPDGSWQPIDPSFRIDPSDADRPVACVTSTVRSRFPEAADAPAGVWIGLDDAAYVVWTPSSIGHDRAGIYTSLAAPAAAAAAFDGSQVRYGELFPGVDDVWRSLGPCVKHDLLLNSAPAIPADAEGFDLAGRVRLPPGFTLAADDRPRTRGSLIVRDAAGLGVLRLAPVWAYETATGRGVRGEYVVLPAAPGEYEIRLRLPAEWLRDPARAYPVALDPTVWPDADGAKVDHSYDWYNFFVGSGTDWGSFGDTINGIYWADGSYSNGNWYDGCVGHDGDDGFFSYEEEHRSAVDWNTASIPDTAVIIDSDIQLNVDSANYSDFDGVDLFFDIHNMELSWPSRDPASLQYNDCADGPLYGDNLYAFVGQGDMAWLDLGATGDGIITGQLPGDWFGVGMVRDDADGYGVTFRLDLCGLEITYNFPPTAPTLIAPADGARTTGNSVPLSWTASTDADGDPIAYEVYCDSSNPPGTLVYSGAATTTTIATVDATTYYWRVRAYDGMSYSAWSSTWWFRENGLPAAPSNSTPPNGSFVQAGSQTVTWTSGGADPDGDGITYEWRVDLSNPPTAPYVSSGTTAGLSSGPFTANDATTYYWHVRAWDGYEYTAFSTVWSFTADGTAPPAPNLLVPADNAQLTDNTPTFLWFPVIDLSGATYEIEILPVGTFGTGGATTYTSGMLADGPYTWHVRATDGVGNVGPWSVTRTFTIDATAPPAPTLLAPADGSLTTNNTPAFDWTDVVDANGVTYEIELTPGGTTAVVPSDYTPASALGDGTYSWRARAIDGFGNVGPWSATWTVTIDTQPPTVPNLIAPPDASFTTSPVTFQWSASFDATAVTYDLEVDDDPAFGSPDFTATTALTTAAAALADGTWFWRVRATDALAQQSAFSEIWSFVVDTVPPVAPTLVAPADGSTTGASPLMTWTSADGVSFVIEIDGVPDTTTNLSYLPAPLIDGLHSWRVLAVDAAGNAGPFSAPWSFTVDATPPTVPALISPVDLAVVATNPVTLVWMASTDASGVANYEVEVFLGPDLVFSESPTATFTTASLPDGAFTWHVRAIDIHGNASAWCATWSFTKSTGLETNPPTAPVLVSPADLSTPANPPTLTWLASIDDTGIAYYRAQVDTEPGFSAPILVNATTTALSMALPVLPSGVYFWRVRAVDQVGNLGPWSATWSFSVGATAPPDAPILLLPPDGFVLLPGAVTLNWTDSAGASFYEVQVLQGAIVVSSATPAVSNAVTGALPQGAYTWRARAIGPGGTSAWSEIWAFTLDPAAPVDATAPVAPMLLSPADGTVGIIDPEVDLLFTEGTDPESGIAYHLVEVFDAGMALVFSAELPGGTDTVGTTPLPNGTYTWTVTAFNGQGLSTPCPFTWTFSIDTTLDVNPPGQVTLVSPADGASLGAGTVTFTWLEAADDGMIAYYEFQLDTDPAFTSPLTFSFQWPDTSIAVVVPVGTYFWRVRAVDANGNVGPFSTSWTVSVGVGAGAGAGVAGSAGGDGSGGHSCTIGFTASSAAPSRAFLALLLAAVAALRVRRHS